jgi:hypothetical protein
VKSNRKVNTHLGKSSCSSIFSKNKTNVAQKLDKFLKFSPCTTCIHIAWIARTWAPGLYWGMKLFVASEINIYNFLGDCVVYCLRNHNVCFFINITMDKHGPRTFFSNVSESCSWGFCKKLWEGNQAAICFLRTQGNTSSETKQIYSTYASNTGRIRSHDSIFWAVEGSLESDGATTVALQM